MSPDNDNTRGDPADVFISVSTDGGAIWGTPTRIDSGPDTTFQDMPTASIDRTSGTIAVHYYDNRSRALNPNGRYLLDVYMTSSANAVPDFFADWRINDAHFDPDPGSPIRFPGPPATHRIGEYNGVSVQNDIAYSVWCGNAGLGQQTMFDAFTLPARTGVPVAGPDDRGRGALDLEASRPNPFRRETSIIYALGTAGPVRLDIYDVGGRRVSGLVDRQEDAGQHAATWDGRDDRGIRMNPGIYFARLQSTGIARIRKIILAR